METGKAPFRHKLFFWAILSAFSTVFAEVIAGSDMFPFFHLWGILVVFPLYALHALVLSHVVFRWGKPNFYALYVAGAIFGMYEAYITKVLWDPSWGAALTLGGVAVFEVFVIALFWHPFLAFMIPLVLCENVLTCSKETMRGMPGIVRRAFSTRRMGMASLFSFCAFAALIQGANSPSVLHSFASVSSSFGILALLAYLWRKRVGTSYPMTDLLPGRKAFALLMVPLIFMYVFTGVFMRPESLPGFFPQLIILLMYAGLFALLYLGLRRSLAENTGIMKPGFRLSWKIALVFMVSLALFSAFFFLTARYIGALAVWLLAGIIGAACIFFSARSILRKK